MWQISTICGEILIHKTSFSPLYPYISVFFEQKKCFQNKLQKTSRPALKQYKKIKNVIRKRGIWKREQKFPIKNYVISIKRLTLQLREKTKNKNTLRVTAANTN